MKNRSLVHVLCMAFAVVSALAGPVSAQLGPARQQGVLGGTGATRQGGSIAGTAWRQDNAPIASGLLRLRSLATGRIAAGAESDAQGRFAFEGVPSGIYLVELVDRQGSVLAVGQTFSVAPGETVATFVRLSGQSRWVDGFFTNAAAAAVSAAASLGLTAVGSGVQPASPRF